MTLTEQFERLAAVEPSPYPVVSLYLNAQPNGHGRDQHQPFVRKELKARAATYPPRSGERGMLDRDLERISSFLESRVDRSANGIAIFACDALKLFETVQLEAPIDAHALVISDRPHLYPLARIVSRYPRYAVVVADSAIETDRAIEGVKTRRTSQGGSSQARFQRHIENYHLQHIKEVVAALEKIVLAEGITQIVVAGDEVALPLIREQLPKMLAAMVVDELSLAANAQPDDVVKATLAAMRAAGAETDRERVGAAVAAYRAGGLGVVGPDETLLALTNGQVDELLLTASLASLEGIHRTPAAEMAIANDSTFAEPAVEPSAAGEPASADMGVVRLADELVRKARQTSARLRIIEDPSLLEPFGGVAATLRYRV
jgi:peptide chain release factor subunit 1